MIKITILHPPPYLHNHMEKNIRTKSKIDGNDFTAMSLLVDAVVILFSA